MTCLNFSLHARLALFSTKKRKENLSGKRDSTSRCHARGVEDEEARRKGSSPGRHERGEDVAAPQVHGEEVQRHHQHRWRGVLPQTVGTLQYLNMGHSW